MNRGRRFDILTATDIRNDAALIEEAQSRVVVTVSPYQLADFKKAIAGTTATEIGVVTSGEMIIDRDFWGTIDWWQDQYDTAIENFLSKEEAGSALSSI